MLLLPANKLADVDVAHDGYASKAKTTQSSMPVEQTGSTTGRMCVCVCVSSQPTGADAHHKRSCATQRERGYPSFWAVGGGMMMMHPSASES